MCLIVFAYNYHPEYPIILAGNRDEFYGRKALKAHVWDTDPKMLAGKDLRAGGTWLGVSKNGEFGAITNYRDLKNPREGERSRGEIITNFLTETGPPDQKLRHLKKQSQEYAGFNLLAGNIRQLFYFSNISGNIQSVAPGIHGISNAFLDTPWPKVETAKSEFEKTIDSSPPDKEKIFKFLQDKQPFPDESLPDTGLSPEMEKAVSPIFIETEGYGTRCSTLLTIDAKERVRFIEKTYPVNKKASATTKELSFETAP